MGTGIVGKWLKGKGQEGGLGSKETRTLRHLRKKEG